MFYSYQSNQLEIPDRATGRRVAAVSAGAPLAREIVITQQRHGPLAGAAAGRAPGRLRQSGVPVSGDFSWEMSRAVLRQVPLTSSFDKSVLVWRVMALLRGSWEDTPRFESLNAYLGDGGDDFRRHELACRIRRRFRSVPVYRPDWIENGSGRSGPLAGRTVAAAGADGRGAPGAVQAQFRKALRDGDFDRRRLPERVAVIGGGAAAVVPGPAGRTGASCGSAFVRAESFARNTGATSEPNAIWPGWARKPIRRTLI